MLSFWFYDRRTRLPFILAASIALAGCGSKGGDEEAKTEEAPPAADSAESAPEAPPAVAGKDAPAAEAPAGGEVASKEPDKDGAKAEKVDFNDNEEMLKLARSSASTPAPAPPTVAAPASGPGGAPGPGAIPSPVANQAASTGGGMMPGGKGIAGPRDAGGPRGGGGAAAAAGAALANEDAPAGPRGGRGGAAPGGGSTAPAGPADYRNPIAGAKTFLAALKAKDLELLSEAVALRSVTEADTEEHRELFKAIREKALDPEELDTMADAFDGMTVQDTNTAKSTGKLGVIVGKTKGKERITRTLFMRKEKAGWKVVDISGKRVFSQNSMTNGRGRR